MDSLLELSAHSSTQHQSSLVNAQGNPLKINLQAVELEGRPRLVRILKGAGALVVSNAKEAAIILVDSTTESGKRLIRTWGHDASKVVLEYTWARASVDVGRPLLEADNWGGSMTVDDGKPVTIDGVVVDQDEIDEVEALVTKSPLPTPRVTPVEPTSQRPENATVEHTDITRSEPKTLAPHISDPQPQGPAQSCTIGVEESMADDTNMAPQNLPAAPPSVPPTQSLPQVQPSLFAQSQNTYAYAPFGTQQSYPSSQAQLMPTQPFQHTSFPSSQPQPHTPNVPHTPLASVQTPVMPITDTTLVNGLNLQAPNPNLATIMTIMEVVRHMNHSSWFGQNQVAVSQPPAISNTSTFTTRPLVVSTPSTSVVDATGNFESPAVNASLFGSQDHPSDSATSSRKRGSVTNVSEDRCVARKPRHQLAHRRAGELLTPSISRKRPPAIKPTNPPLKRLRKGKERAISTDSSEPSQSNELMEVSDGPCSTQPSASPPAHSRNIIARKKHGEIFLSGSGQPLRFFVQVDLHGRHTVVTNIKKNKGKIVNNIADADYLILFSRSDTFQGLLNEAIALGKTPILSAFVADCIEERALLDETDYILESVKNVRPLRPGRQNAFSIKVETPVLLPLTPKVAKARTSPAVEERKMPKGGLSMSLEDKISKTKTRPRESPPITETDNSTTARPPTPPPATTRRPMKSGRYLFTAEEDEYFLRLAKYHLTRDPAISNTALVNKLHEQLPHHTAASWAVHIDKKLKATVEGIRKRASIANRKRASEAAYQNSSQEVVNEHARILDANEGNDDISLKPSQPSQQGLEQQDFDVITRFFAEGGGDDDDDERVWQQLERHQSCRSTSSWPEYFAAHEKQVCARIEELMNERAGG